MQVVIMLLLSDFHYITLKWCCEFIIIWTCSAVNETVLLFQLFCVHAEN